jgi:2-oxo-4-hydroxy-4-carboxy-5-ureidoimidazoline decarboxylase
VALSVAEFDAMSAAQAAELLAACCGAQRWVSGMLARRPFGSRRAILAAADLESGSLTPNDWREAFSHHPRIGERTGEVLQSESGQRWSAGEQREVHLASADVREALARVNREYEARFGYIYIVCATGRSAEAMLAIARARLANAPDSEFVNATREQQNIMTRRLEALLR